MVRSRHDGETGETPGLVLELRVRPTWKHDANLERMRMGLATRRDLRAGRPLFN